MKASRKLLFGKTLLVVFIATIVVTVLLVYLTGLTSHRSIIDNALISLTILAICFFLFLSYTLYNGLDVNDNYSHKLHFMWKRATTELPESTWAREVVSNAEIPDVGDGLAGIILGIVLWILFSIVLVFLLVAFQAIVWITIVLVAIAIYWVLIRGLKLVFSKSEICQGNLTKSTLYALAYTTFYIGWIYVIILLSVLF